MLDAILDKLSELWKISCLIPHLVEIQDALHGAKISINHYENWYKMKVLVSKHQNYKIFVKCLVKGMKQGPIVDVVFETVSK